MEGVEHIEVPLIFDGQFFDILQSDVNSLDALQQDEQKSMTKDVVALGKEITEVTRPSKFSKNDLSRWRDIFELYLDAQVFFSSGERSHSTRTSSASLKQLVWFQDEVARRDLPGRFKLPASQVAYGRFLRLNAALLQNLKFQEINRTAIRKILKSEPLVPHVLARGLTSKVEFDKRTSLGVAGTFPAAVRSEHFMAESVAKDICAQVSRDVVSVVPRLDDYICPICMSIAWLPVRLECRHVFCVRCVIKMQRDSKRHCPLCRGDVVMQADLSKFLVRILDFDGGPR